VRVVVTIHARHTAVWRAHFVTGIVVRTPVTQFAAESAFGAVGVRQTRCVVFRRRRGQAGTSLEAPVDTANGVARLVETAPVAKTLSVAVFAGEFIGARIGIGCILVTRRKGPKDEAVCCLLQSFSALSFSCGVAAPAVAGSQAGVF